MFPVAASDRPCQPAVALHYIPLEADSRLPPSTDKIGEIHSAQPVERF
jgi:hypothetical protein